MDLDSLLKFMTKKGASDLHLKPTRPPLLRVDGKIVPVDLEPFRPDALREMLEGILDDAQKRRLEENKSVDLGYGVRGLARFRGNLYLQRGSMAATFRRVPFNIASAEDLDLPETLLDFCKIHMGLVLVTGPTGSGKSTTLAAMIKHISRTRQVHVITIEDPMEFLFTDNMATISQREVGTDTVSFAEALRNAMRQDPDVIMVGEMRDPETVATVITAAETGHLVFSTLHTNSAPQTIDRILDTFPSDQQPQIRAQLGQILKGVISMKLVERKDGGRVASLEILKASPKVSNMVEKGEIGELHEELESSVGYYKMQSMNQSLLSLLVNGSITYDEAMNQSTDPEDLSLKLRKLFPKLIESDSTDGDDDMSSADFSQIHELLEFRRLFEEQEEKVKQRMLEKDEVIGRLETVVSDRDRSIDQLEDQIRGLQDEADKQQGEYTRLRQEAQEKIDKLMQRIRQLTQGAQPEAPPPPPKKSGIFR
ncbi:MAG: PilT/PilU family type 4a pilus ATPase [Acidobacteriota bacterium]